MNSLSWLHSDYGVTTETIMLINHQWILSKFNYQNYFEEELFLLLFTEKYIKLVNFDLKTFSLRCSVYSFYGFLNIMYWKSKSGLG